MKLAHLKKYYSQIAVIIFNTLLLFILLNIGASFWLKETVEPTPPKRLPLKQIYQPSELIQQLEDPNNLLYRVYPGYSSEEIKAIFRKQSQLVDHPTLGTMVLPGQRGEFHSGKEGVRYDDYITPANIDSLINGSIWLMGGSTLYGHCLAQRETISNYLNQLDPDNAYLNFGVPGHHQNSEVERLLMLLKKGYRPKKVLFLDGNNDLLSNLHINLHPAESPQRRDMAFPLKNRARSKKKLSAEQFIKRLPLIALLERKSKPAPLAQEDWKMLKLPYENLGDSTSLYLRQGDTYYEAIKTLPCSVMPFYPQKILELYKINQDFVDRLATVYNFEYEFIFQPLGFLNFSNPFIKDTTNYRDAFSCLELLETTQQVVRDSIQAGALPHFRDFSQAADKCENCYVDLVHYSGLFNRQLAEMILASTE